jgi:hypothetical protein
MKKKAAKKKIKKKSPRKLKKPTVAQSAVVPEGNGPGMA